jgi:hypothetical protein
MVSVRSARSLVRSGSGSHGPTYTSRRAQLVHAHPNDHRRQERARRLQVVWTRAIPSQVCLLEHILGVGDGAEEAIRDRKQIRAVPLELIEAIILREHRRLRVNHATARAG